MECWSRFSTEMHRWKQKICRFGPGPAFAVYAIYAVCTSIANAFSRLICCHLGQLQVFAICSMICYNAAGSWNMYSYYYFAERWAWLWKERRKFEYEYRNSTTKTDRNHLNGFKLHSIKISWNHSNHFENQTIAIRHYVTSLLCIPFIWKLSTNLPVLAINSTLFIYQIISI